MQKPNGYDEAKSGGEFIPVELGGHYAIIKQVTEMQSANGKDMVVVLLDFAAEDKQVHYHSDAFDNDSREERKWPYNGSKWIMVKDYNDSNKTSRDFKTFCTCYEKSNNATVQWGGKNWATQFKNKKIGIVYGEVESEYDGKVTMKHLPRWFCTWDAVKDANIPNPKYLDNNTTVSAHATTGKTVDDNFINVPEGVDESIPF